MKKSNYNINDLNMYPWSVQNIASICHSNVSLSKYINRTFSGGVPIVVKGCMSVEDALLAQRAGADGIYISNHGGRFLYNSVSPLEMLPLIREKVKQVDKNFGIWIDGGIRSGSDIYGAYCKGAEFVGLGRPLIYACVLYGETGVSSFQKKFMFELESQASLCGQNDLNDYEILKSSLIQSSEPNLKL
jgi:isopentenyl diphosphate isomerase/L-lactate dehydrogenase-like FMN-dependent dehydrogenase